MKKRLAVLVLAFAMVLTMSASVFAAGPVTNTGTTVYLTKEFNVPQGVDVPTDDFTFAATPNDASTEVDYVPSTTTNYPSLSFTKINFANGDRAKASDTKLVRSSSVDLSSLSFPRAGLYEWTISENALTGANKDKIEKDSATYTLRVYVKNGENNTRVIDTITVQKDPNGDKVDAGKEDKDVTADEDGDDNFTNDGNDFRFVNNYKPQDVETNPTDPSDGSSKSGAFKLTKTTTGDYADKTHAFEFTVTVTLPSGVDADDYPITGLTDGKVKLADGGTWSIAKLPEGTLITVSEEATAHYTPSYAGKHSIDTATGNAKDLAVAQAQKGEGLAVAETIVVGTKGANVAYTNTFEDSDVTPTGIIINNLPYILLIGLALGGIVIFSRKRRYE